MKQSLFIIAILFFHPLLPMEKKENMAQIILNKKSTPHDSPKLIKVRYLPKLVGSTLGKTMATIMVVNTDEYLEKERIQTDKYIKKKRIQTIEKTLVAIENNNKKDFFEQFYFLDRKAKNEILEMLLDSYCCDKKPLCIN